MIPENWKYTIVTEKTKLDYSERAKYFLFFDENGILREKKSDECLLIENAPGYYGTQLFLRKKKHIDGDLQVLFEGYNSNTTSKLFTDYMKSENKVDIISYDDFIEYVKNWKINHSRIIEKQLKPHDYSSVDRFITKTGIPHFQKSENGILFILVELFTIHEWPEKTNYIKENLKAIKEIALNKIENSASFKKREINLKDLKFASIKFIKSHDILEIVFKI